MTNINSFQNQQLLCTDANDLHVGDLWGYIHSRRPNVLAFERDNPSDEVYDLTLEEARAMRDYLNRVLPPDETTPVITPLEQLIVDWWTTDMDHAELFNRTVRLSKPLATAMTAALGSPVEPTPLQYGIDKLPEIKTLNVDWIPVDNKNLPDFRIYGYHCKDDQQNQIKVWFKRVNGSIILDIYQGWGIFGMGDGYKDVTHWLPTNLKNPYKE